MTPVGRLGGLAPCLRPGYPCPPVKVASNTSPYIDHPVQACLQGVKAGLFRFVCVFKHSSVHAEHRTHQLVAMRQVLSCQSQYGSVTCWLGFPWAQLEHVHPCGGPACQGVLEAGDNFLLNSHSGMYQGRARDQSLLRKCRKLANSSCVVAGGNNTLRRQHFAPREPRAGLYPGWGLPLLLRGITRALRLWQRLPEESWLSQHLQLPGLATV